LKTSNVWLARFGCQQPPINTLRLRCAGRAITGHARAAEGDRGRRKEMSRHQRRRVEFAQRASMQRYRGEASGKGGLLTFLIDAREPIREPILARAASWWRNLLPSASRHCFVCNCIFLARFDVAALLLSTPALKSSRRIRERRMSCVLERGAACRDRARGRTRAWRRRGWRQARSVCGYVVSAGLSLDCGGEGPDQTVRQ
jgi:hypothetical protein